jgi:selenoprotein W-related protein
MEFPVLKNLFIADNSPFITMKPTVTIEYCPKCGWLLRAAYMAQELLTTFSEEIAAVTLKPSEVAGRYTVSVNDEIVFDRKRAGGFAEIKEIKQLVRDVAAPEKSLGHSDRKIEP